MKTSNEIIDLLGGTSAVARLVNAAPSSVHEWREKGFPDGRLLFLAATIESKKIATRKQLFPKTWKIVWPELAKPKK